MLQGTHKIIEIGKHIKDSWPLFYVDISIRGKFPYGDLKWFNGCQELILEATSYKLLSTIFV